MDATNAEVEDQSFSSSSEADALAQVPESIARPNHSSYERTEFDIERRVLPPTTLGKGATDGGGLGWV